MSEERKSLMDEKQMEVFKNFLDTAKKKEKVSYLEIADSLETLELDKDQMEFVYDTLMAHGIELVSDDPGHNENMDMDDEDPSASTIDDEEEVEIDLSLPKGINVDDPVRMYLKEIVHHFIL